MTQVITLTFNPFQENTYLLYDESKECIVIDPGCFNQAEEQILTNKIKELSLTPVRLINTHCHIDHVFGNHFIAEKYGLDLEIHRGEIPVLEAVPQIGKFYGVPLGKPSPQPGRFIEEGEVIEFGKSKLKTLFTPGHSPGEICLLSEADRFVIAGDVLFYGSIGRTDLPGGDLETLLSSIRSQLFSLEDDVKVYPGHGPATSIGFEREHNPFLK